MANFSVLKDNVLLHMTQEENIIFPYAGKLISKEQLNEMGQKMMMRKTRKAESAKIMKNQLSRIKSKAQKTIRRIAKGM